MTATKKRAKRCIACRMAHDPMGTGIFVGQGHLCANCRPNEPQPLDAWSDTKSTQTAIVHSARDGKVQYFIGKDFYRLRRRTFLNRFRFVRPIA